MTKKLVLNVVKRPYRFLVHYTDGRTEERIIEAESKDAAFLILQDQLWDEDAEAKAELKSEEN